jgi:hypothetical protein
MSRFPQIVDGWIESATSADDTVGTATRAAVVGQESTDPLGNTTQYKATHYVTAIGADCDEAGTTVLTLSDGATAIGTWTVHNQRDIEFPVPIEATPGNAVSVSTAAGGNGVACHSYIVGFTA